MKKLTKHFAREQLLFLILCTIPTIELRLVSISTETRGGKHFVVSGISSIAGFNMKRNASGHIIELGGSANEMLIWLSQFYNFTYSVFQMNSTSIDSSSSQPGLINYLLRGEIDMLISLSATQSRMSFLDFSHPTLYVPVSFVIPVPVSSFKIEAIIKPFQPMVWLALIVSISCVILALSFISRHANIILNFGRHARIEKNSRWGQSSLYVLGILLNQGGRLFGKRLSYYWIGGTWCISTFVIINAYNSTLISHVTLPYTKPLIKSIFDLRSRPDIYLVTDRNKNTDAVLSAADTGFYKILGDKLREYPESRCNSTKECVALVKSGSHVYSSGMNSFLYGAIAEDFEATGQCNLQLEKESYMDLGILWALPKGNQHMKYLNRGIMQMRAAGLIDLWNKEFQPDARKCLAKGKASKLKNQAIKQLRLGNLMGSFVVLAIGFLVSLVVFVSEQIIFHRFKMLATTEKSSP